MSLGGHWLIVLAGMLVGVAGDVSPAESVEVQVDVDGIVSGMTLKQKVGQLMLVGFAGTKVTPEITKWVRDRRVGGVALFSRNIIDLEQTLRFTRQLHGLSRGGLPPFISLDQEGGNVVRVKDGATVLPGNMALGATRSPTLAYVGGQALAIDLRRLGFNMNLAPVLDVNSNPSNPVIGIRSFGERPELVGALGSWAVRGQQEMGVVAVAKHFPGHGDTHSDSHFAMPSINTTLERLLQVELAPFQQAIDAGLDAIMTAHIALPAISESPDVPATLSKRILSDLLRGRMGFDGIIITDGLEMRSIVDRYGAGRAAVKAIKAGADMAMILWASKKKEEVYRALIHAVESGDISQRRLEQSVRRILKVKARRGLFNRDLEPIEQVLRHGNRNPLHQQVARRIADESVTLVRNHGDMLPLHPVRYRKVVVMAPPGAFGGVMAHQDNVKLISVPFVPSRRRRNIDAERVIAAGKNADALVVVAVNRYHIGMVRQISRALPHTPITLVSFASPYYLSSIPTVDAYVCTYSYQEVAQRAAADAVLGKIPMRGRLPISIPGYYPYGHRVHDQLASLPSGVDDVHSP